MLSIWLDTIFLACCGFALVSRLILQLSFKNLESQGPEHLATLINSFIVFAISFLYITKKTWLRENIRLPKIFWPLGLFCLLANLSILYSIDAPTSLLYSFDLWSSLLFMIVLVNLLSTIKTIEITVGLLSLLMGLASLHAIYEHLFLAPPILGPNTDRATIQLIISHRTPTLFGWPNILAGFMVMMLPLCIYLILSTRQLWVKFIAILAAALAIYALFITMTVSCWLGLLIETILFFLILKKQDLAKPIKFLGLILLFLITIAIAFTTFKKMSQHPTNSIDAREQYFSSACHLIQEHPLLGSGWLSFAVASFAYIKDINGRSTYAHNSYLQICSELGIIGLLLFLSFIWFLFKDGLALLHEHNQSNRWLICALMAGLSGCMIDNLFSYTMLKPQVSIFWWVLCALLIALKENIKLSTPFTLGQGSFKKIILILSLMGGFFTMRLALAEYDFFTAVHDIHQGDQNEKAIALCLEAKELNPWDKKFDLARAYALYSLYLQNHDRSTLQSAQEAILLTQSQVSLGYERDALLTRINDSLAH